MKETLEASIHQYIGDKDKSLSWMNRVTNKEDEELINKLLFGEFLYWTGSKIEVLPNTTRSHTLK